MSGEKRDPSRIVRIGGASGFWGDSDWAASRLLREGKLDYAVFDYLAELTMSILASARAKSPDLGYATDFVTGVMASCIRDVAASGTRILSNAGGLNPRACAAALEEVARQADVALKIAYVEGDDLLERMDHFRAADVRDMGSGLPLPPGIVSANAYLGARPIAEALSRGAQIVITGRSVDSALALGALVHEFGWSFEDFDRLATGSLVGHLLECGAQATGGLHTDWQNVERWEDIGYPIAECRADGLFWITKPPDTGGLVSVPVVAEQMLYEIGDPASYQLPDVFCDFTEVEMTEAGKDRVEVRGAHGRPPSGLYKISTTYRDGFRLTVQLTIIGIDAAQKARRTAEALLARTRRMLRDRNLGDFTEIWIDVLGAESAYGPHSRATGAREVVMRLSVRHPDRAALLLMAREVAQAGTSWSPGTTGAGKRAEPVPVVRLFSFLTPAEPIETKVVMDGAATRVPPPRGVQGAAAIEKRKAIIVPERRFSGRRISAPLVRIAYARSGDKGDISNIGIIARKPEYEAILREEVTADRVKAYFGHIVAGRVERFDVPGIHAFNFVLHQALGGGGMASLRADPLGKGMGQMLLDMEIEIPEELLRN